MKRFARNTGFTNKEMTRNILVIVALLCTVLLPLITLTLSRFGSNNSNLSFDADIRSFNNWEEITIPTNNQDNQTTSFKYQIQVHTDKSCLDRTKYSNEFFRIFNMNPYYLQTNTEYVLVIGTNTNIGEAVVKALRSQNIPYIGIKGIIDIDIAAIFNAMSYNSPKIKKAIICAQPISHKIHNKNFNLYNERQIVHNIKSYCESLIQFKIPFIIAHFPPYSSSLIEIANWFEVPIILIPFISKFSGTKDLENPINRVVAECIKFNKSTVDSYENYPFTSIKFSDIANFLINYNDLHRKSTERIISFNSESFSDLLQNNFEKSCEIKFTNEYKLDNNLMSKYKAVELTDSGNPTKLLKSSIPSTIVNQSNPYLSIVVASRNDPYHRSKLQTFLDILDLSIQKIPLAKIEIVIVDYNNKNTTKYVNVDKHLTGKVKFIKVPEQIHQEIQQKVKNENEFIQSAAKYIGLSHSNGQFILLTNPDIILPAKLLDYTASGSFMDGVVYRSNRIDIRNTYAEKLNLNQIFDLVNSPWELNDNNDAAPFCINEYHGTFILKEFADFKQNMICSTQDFILASKNMWKAIGYLGASQDDDKDAQILANFMKFINGVTMKYLPDPVLELNINEPKIIQDMPHFSSTTVSKICNGKSDELSYSFLDNIQFDEETL